MCRLRHRLGQQPDSIQSWRRFVCCNSSLGGESWLVRTAQMCERGKSENSRNYLNGSVEQCKCFKHEADLEPASLDCLYQYIGKQMCGLGGEPPSPAAVADGRQKGGTVGPKPMVEDAIRC